MNIKNQDSSVGIATDYVLDDRGSISGKGNIFLISIVSRPALGPTHLPMQMVPGAGSPGITRQGHKAHHSLPSSAEVKNSGARPP
jgi:hypothetical protein